MTKKHKAYNIKNRVRRNFERGNALIMLAVALPVLIGIAGLALDYGRGAWTQTQLQKAADSGALAAAGELPYVYQAGDRAVEMVAANFGDPDDATYTSLGDRYRVQLTENVPVYFMRIFGRTTMKVSVSATAIMSMPIGGLNGGAFPFAIINPNLNSDPADDLDPDNYGREYIIMFGEDNVMVPDWANGSDPVPEPSDGNSRGWRGALGLCIDGTSTEEAGTDDVVYAMEHGWPGSANIGDPLSVKLGNIDTPINTARNNLLGTDPVSWLDFDPVYDADCSRVVMVPIIHMVNVTRQDTYTIQDYNNGAAWEHDYIVIDGYAPFFIETVEEQGDLDGDGNADDRDWIVGRFIPGVQTRNFAPPVAGAPDFGLYCPPRLVE